MIRGISCGASRSHRVQSIPADQAVLARQSGNVFPGPMVTGQYVGKKRTQSGVEAGNRIGTQHLWFGSQLGQRLGCGAVSEYLAKHGRDMGRVGHHRSNLVLI